MACLCCCKYEYFCQKQCSDLTWRFSLAYYYTAQITWFKTLHLFDTSLNGQENSVRDIRKWQAELFYIWLKIAMYYQHSQICLFIFSVQRSFKKEVKEKKEKKQKLNCWWDVEMQNLQDTAQKISNAEGMVRQERFFQSYKLGQSRITALPSRGFSLICSAAVLFSPPWELQEFMGLIT